MPYAVTIGQTKDCGRGVFAQKDFAPGEIIEVCPVVPIPVDEQKYIGETIVEYYAFEWQTPQESALVLGYGMLYNHSYDHPNAKYTIDYSEKTVTFTAITPITAGEEILYNYNANTGTNPIEMLHPHTGEPITISPSP